MQFSLKTSHPYHIHTKNATIASPENTHQFIASLRYSIMSSFNFDPPAYPCGRCPWPLVSREEPLINGYKAVHADSYGSATVYPSQYLCTDLGLFVGASTPKGLNAPVNERSLYHNLSVTKAIPKVILSLYEVSCLNI